VNDVIQLILNFYFNPVGLNLFVGWIVVPTAVPIINTKLKSCVKGLPSGVHQTLIGSAGG